MSNAMPAFARRATYVSRFMIHNVRICVVRRNTTIRPPLGARCAYAIHWRRFYLWSPHTTDSYTHLKLYTSGWSHNQLRVCLKISYFFFQELRPYFCSFLVSCLQFFCHLTRGRDDHFSWLSHIFSHILDTISFSWQICFRWHAGVHTHPPGLPHNLEDEITWHLPHFLQ